MTTDVVTVRPGAAYRELAVMFRQHRVSGFPVVGDNGKVTGVVSETDLLAEAAEPVPGPHPALGRVPEPIRRSGQLGLGCPHVHDSHLVLLRADYLKGNRHEKAPARVQRVGPLAPDVVIYVSSGCAGDSRS